jgi:hypothetical protein
MAPSAIGAFLNNIPTPWAVVFAGAIGSLTYDLSVFCTQDPPAFPAMTAADWAALINPYTLSSSLSARSKFRDWLGALLWPTLCQCDTVSTPAPPDPGAAPTDLPVLNPPGVGPAYPTGQACGTFDFGDITFTGTGTHLFDRIPIGQITTATIDLLERSRDHDTIGSVSFFGEWLTSAGAFISSFGVGTNTSGVTALHASSAAPSNAAFLVPGWQVTGGMSAPITMHSVIQMFCGTTPGAPAGPVPTPCPTDPYTQLQLDQLLALVTLIQRQAVPFAYVPGATHSGLSGEGHLDVQGLLGVKVTLDSTSSSVGFLSGDPAEIYSAGWLTWGNSDGSTKREFITHSPFVSLPAVAGQYTRLGYTLGDGVTATITELVREP